MTDTEKTRRAGGGEAVPQVVIRQLTEADRETALAVINEAARWYREFLPPDEYHELEMTADEWDAEARRLTWFGAFLDGTLVGVGGLEHVRDVALLRHGYVLPVHQRVGIGALLVECLEKEVRGVKRVIVGTYRGNYKAQHALQKAGYRQSPDPEAVLRAYYAIPEARLQASITYEKTLPSK
jgi:GNAT superfamily N-acetyltransferase